MDMDDHTYFTEEALKSQDGNKVPLRAFPGGPIIGTATMKYDPETKTLGAMLHVDDPKMAEILGKEPPSVIFKQGE